MIGLSISSCIKDIALGRVKLAEVQLIIAGTNGLNRPESRAYILNNYRDHYWSELPNAESIFWVLFAEGRIVEPRALGGEAPNIGLGHWLKADTLELAKGNLNWFKPEPVGQEW